MLTVICGEDSVSSFNYYSSLKKDYQEKKYDVMDISSSDLGNISAWMGESSSLFSQKKVFMTKNVNKKLSRKLNLKINNIVGDLIKDKNVELIDWEEEISSRFLKFPKGVIIKEFKPPQNIFKLQDALIPGNLKNFLEMLNLLNESLDENFIFVMLLRHVRNLVLVRSGQSDSKLPPWQLYKLKAQATKWDLEKLVNFYDSFHKIDLSQKTSTNPYSIKKSLDILVSYYL